MTTEIRLADGPFGGTVTEVELIGHTLLMPHGNGTVRYRVDWGDPDRPIAHYAGPHVWAKYVEGDD